MSSRSALTGGHSLPSPSPPPRSVSSAQVTEAKSPAASAAARRSRCVVRALRELGQSPGRPFLFRWDILQPDKQALRERQHRLTFAFARPHQGDAPAVDRPDHARRGEPRAETCARER